MDSKLKYRPTTLNIPQSGKSSSSNLFNLVDPHDPYRLLKYGIWWYFFLLIFEGALRKWFLPSLSAPLLIIRDPLALWLIILTWKKGLLPRTPYISIMVMVGIIGIYTAMAFGHGSLPVAIYGARILLIHFPFMFVIGRIFNRDDVIKMGKITLWIAIPMALLITLQFYSPQSAWVNRGVGGDMEGAGFSGALGYFRPPGTFSFTNGNTLFFSFVGCYVFYFWINRNNINKIVLIGSTIALLVAIPFSLSRGLFFHLAITLIFAAIAISRKPKKLGSMVIALVVCLLGFAILSNTHFFQTATEAFNYRFKTATENEGGLNGVLIDRYLGGLIGAISDADEHPFFGYGIGMGTSAGNKMLTGEQGFSISEGEWGRIVGEMGPLLGLAIIMIRLSLSFVIARAAYRKMIRNNLLPWMLLNFCLLTLPMAQWGQPSALGFSTLMGGLLIAAIWNINRQEYSK